jgi:FtsP/CotA-like multicopper oxidase with cupredoxin domain
MKKWSIFCAGIFSLLLTVGLALDSAQACHVKFGQNLKLIPTLTGGETMQHNVITTGGPSDTITIVASDDNVQICPTGAATPMWTLGGDVPPPIIRRTTNPDTNNQGATRLTIVNNLSEITQNTGNGDNVQTLGGGTQVGVPGNHSEISIHHHGSHVAPVGDGWACGYYIRSTNDGSSTLPTSRTYDFFLRENDSANNTGGERGTTEWYHNHRVDVTGHTAWRGLAGGMFILDDPNDPQLPKGPAVVNALGQPAGFKYDVSLVIRDLQFNSNTNHSAPYRFDPQGSTGDHILVNGIPQPKFAVEPTKYLFRVLVPGNARKYFMRLRRTNSNSNINMAQVMQEGGIVAPVNRTEIPVGIAERVGIVIDFAPFAGQSLILQNNDGASGQCVPGNCSSSTKEIMRFDVGTTVTQQENINVNAITRNVPNNNSNSAFYIGNSVKNRAFRFTSEGQPFWTIVREDLNNDDADRIMDCRRYDADPVVNTVEQWTIHGVGNWTHSIHIHDVDQVCVSRNGASCPASDRFKEVWPIAPGVTFVVKLKPTDFTQASAKLANNDACTTSPPFSGNPDNKTSTSGDCANQSFNTTSSNHTIPDDTPNYHGTPQPDVSAADGIDGEVAGGRYMLHCHVLEHEDTAMMTQWRVKSVSNNGNTRSDVPCATPGGCSP